MNLSGLRILHTNFHRGWGGQPSRILMLCQGLTEKGHQIVIAAPPGSLLADKARDAGLETFEEPQFRQSKWILSALRDAASIHGLLKRRGFDLVDAHGSQDLWASAAAVKVGRHLLPLVYTRHNTKRVADHPANRFLYRHLVDHLILVSGSILERYGPILNRGDFSRDRISVVHSSYWEDRFHPGVDGTAARRELGADGTDSVLVGVVGRLVADKGGIHFLKAAAKIAPQFPSARFLFVGRGKEEEKLRRRATELGLSGRVSFLGFREDMPLITAALDLSVLPSVDCDASSAALKEAMAVGRPVIATDVGGAKEIVEHGRTGLVVPPADPDALASAMEDILRREDRGRSLGEAGSQRVRNEFSRERLVEGTLEAYRKALQRWRKNECS